MNTLDELLEHEIKAGKLYRYSDLGADALEVRREMVRLRNELNRLKKYENLRRWGTSIGNGISKIIGYNIILWALIDDIDLALSGFGSLEAIYG